MENQLGGIFELNVEQLEQVEGAGFGAIIGGAAAYMALIDFSMQFGAGLGAGIYDSMHRR